MALAKQAKILSKPQMQRVSGYLETTRHPIRNKTVFLLSVKAGLRAKEISSLNWSMLTDAEGYLAEAIHLPNSASKGSNGGRAIPLNKELLKALDTLYQETSTHLRQPNRPVILSERGGRMSAQVVVNFFKNLYGKLDFNGCSSHSGRRTFITAASKAIVTAGGSLRDIQQLAGHSSLQTTQRYIEGDSAAKRRVVDMI